MSQPAKVLIVDDHPIVRSGLAALIAEQPELLVCGEAANGAEALRGVSTLSPDLVIIDRDYLTCPEDEIQDIRVVQTILGGKVVYERAKPQ